MPIHHPQSLIARTLQETLHKALKTLALVLLSLCVPMGAAHAQSACGPQFLAGQAPVLLNPALAQNAHMLCYEIYAIADSGVTRTPLWSAEHLTSDEVLAARQQPRVDAFHPETALPPAERSEREDFFGSGFDEGHMSPSGDAPNPRAQFETFSLGNIVPQDPDNNRHLWQGIEIAARGLARYDRELYIVTGPAFVGPRGLVGGRVSVPTHIWKAIYDPRRGAAAYITLNRPGFLYSEISIAELARLTGIDPFPALSPAIKATAMSLPAPRPSGQPLDIGPVPEQMLGLGGPVQVSTLTGPIVPVVSERAWEVPHNRPGFVIDVLKQGYDRYRQYRDTHAVNSQPPQIN